MVQDFRMVLEHSVWVVGDEPMGAEVAAELCLCELWEEGEAVVVAIHQ